MPDKTSVQQEIAEIEVLIASLRKKLSGAVLEQTVKELEGKREGLQPQLIGSGAIA